MSKWNRSKAKEQIKSSKFKYSYIAKYCGVSVGTLYHYISSGKNKAEPSQAVVALFNELMRLEQHDVSSAISNTDKPRQTGKRL